MHYMIENVVLVDLVENVVLVDLVEVIEGKSVLEYNVDDIVRIPSSMVGLGWILEVFNENPVT